MKRQHYFPRILSQRPEWFNNYATQLPIANAVLAMPAPEVTASVADARFCEYASGAWLAAVREFGPASSSALDDLYDGPGGAPFVLPVFTVPPLPAGATPVPSGALQRIFAFVQAIKARPTYTEAIGLQLGIVGPEEQPGPALPTFTLRIERAGGCECVRIIFKKYGHEAVLIQSRRPAAPGAPWEVLGIDFSSPYLDERPLLAPTTPEVREYRLQFYDNAAPSSGFTDVASVTVAP
jgi:hypothetical protein